MKLIRQWNQQEPSTPRALTQNCWMPRTRLRVTHSLICSSNPTTGSSRWTTSSQANSNLILKLHAWISPLSWELRILTRRPSHPSAICSHSLSQMRKFPTAPMTSLEIRQLRIWPRLSRPETLCATSSRKKHSKFRLQLSLLKRRRSPQRSNPLALLKIFHLQPSSWCRQKSRKRRLVRQQLIKLLVQLASRYRTTSKWRLTNRWSLRSFATP